MSTSNLSVEIMEALLNSLILVRTLEHCAAKVPEMTCELGANDCDLNSLNVKLPVLIRDSSLSNQHYAIYCPHLSLDFVLPAEKLSIMMSNKTVEYSLGSLMAKAFDSQSYVPGSPPNM